MVEKCRFSRGSASFFGGGQHCEACGILVPQPGIEPGPWAVKVWSPNHWTAREFLGAQFLEDEFEKPVTHPSGTVQDATGLMSLGSGI